MSWKKWIPRIYRENRGFLNCKGAWGGVFNKMFFGEIP